MTPDLNPVRDALSFLYGPSALDDLTERLQALIRKHQANLKPPPTAGDWSQRDAFLIAYPDQVRDSPTPPLQSLLAFCRRQVANRFSGLHILPFYPSSSDDGFSVTDYRAVDPAFGDWQDLSAFADSFRLMVDLVLNHASAQGAWFDAFRRGEEPFRRFFLTPDPSADWSRVVRPRTSPLFTSYPAAGGERLLWTTFGPDQVDLDYRTPELLLEMIDVLLEYAARGAQMIRLDAVTYIWKQAGTGCVHLPQGHALVRLLRAVLDLAAPWVRLVTETNVPHHDNIAYFGDGREADLVYQFPLPPLLTLALLTGDASRLSEWMSGLERPPGDATFFNFLASHDGIGLYPVHGILTDNELHLLESETVARGGAVSSRSADAGRELPYELNINLLDLLTEPEQPGGAVDRFLVAHAILLSLAGIPAVYFHSLVGSRGDLRAVRQTGIPRRINREKLSATTLLTELETPGTERHKVHAGLARLLQARASHEAFAPSSEQEVLDMGPSLFAIRRGPIACIHNVSGTSQGIDPPPGFRQGRDLLAGTALTGPRWRLQPYQSLWVSAEP